jgi:hypothetical protein
MIVYTAEGIQKYPVSDFHKALINSASVIEAEGEEGGIIRWKK